jgi:2-polyprenyl-6-hydroxyphenyl methylase / 3-demethylubiquinone-9 3-methyltransferase
MLRKDVRSQAFQASVAKANASGQSTADPAEIARFERLADEWWNPDGAFKVVHAFNAVRVSYLTECLPRLSGRGTASNFPLDGLDLLDVGCGAGIVTEPLSRLGARTLGIDAAERNVLIASRHAATSDAPTRYRHALPEELVAEGRTFDLVLSLEVIEHVASVPIFLSALAALVAPGGLLVMGTLNRTPLSYVKAIVAAEYVLGWLPKGTHDWRKFVRPNELDEYLSPLGFDVVETRGVQLNPLTMRWRMATSIDTNYLQLHRKRPSASSARSLE